MGGRKFHLHDGKKGAALAIRITPRASQNEIVDILGDGTVKVHISADSSDQNMNTQLLKFLAEILEVSMDRLEIVAGVKGRDKLVSILDMEPEILHSKLILLKSLIDP